MERFWSKVSAKGIDDCWEWTASKFKSGYGAFRLNGVTQYAHRMSWKLVNGEIPDHTDSKNRYCVLHKCDNRGCVNPNHLFLGTDMDNRIDCKNKGRHSRGETCGRSKLTEIEVMEIRALYRSKLYSQRTIGRMYSVSSSLISYITNRKNWTHI